MPDNKDAFKDIGNLDTRRDTTDYSRNPSHDSNDRDRDTDRDRTMPRGRGGGGVRG